jgi:septal ring factor EnvC (AmiA/AmiB activator)
MKEITELRYDSDRKDEEIERLRKEDSSLGGSLEIERRSRQKQLAELHARDGELMLMRCVAVVDIFVIAYNHDN